MSDIPTWAQGLENFDPTNIEQLKEVFKRLKKPRNFKKFGQHFLRSKNAVNAIIDAAEISADDIVLEIGPGPGVLTQKMAARAKKIVALDIDPYLLEVTKLATNFAENVETRLQDVRHTNLAKLFKDEEKCNDYIAVSNLPYYLTGFLIEKLLTSPCSPRRMVLTMQEEVAERILAQPGQLSILAISVAVFGKARLVAKISRRYFWPEPSIDSAVIRIDRYLNPLVPLEEQKRFFRVVKAGFSSRRKKLSNALAGGLHLTPEVVKKALNQAEIDLNARAQELDIEKWALLSGKLPVA